MRSTVPLASSVVGASLPGPPLVVLHGLFGSSRNWRSPASFLSAQLQRPVHLLDLRNHGSTAPHQDSMTLREMSDDVVAHVEQHSLALSGEMELMGHSMGGKVAMDICLRMPELARKLVVVDVAPLHYDPEDGEHDRLIDTMLAVPMAQLKSRKEVDAHLARGIPEAGVRLFLMTNIRHRKEGGLEWAVPLEVLRSHLPHVRGFPPYFDEGGFQYTRPALFISGANSPYVQEQHRPIISKMFTDARYEVLEGAGHWVHAEKPAEFGRAVAAFLKEG